jgi:hypothetical protein
MRAQLVECSDHDYTYGILSVENANIEAVQKKIYEIKKELYDNGIDDWCLDDVFERFPEDWVWDFENGTDNIIEI